MKVKYLTFAIAAALAPYGSAFAAEETKEQEKKEETRVEETEVIEVTGIRNSLKEAQAIKKVANNIIDAIVAEDIGKFPDENVAEALQRVPGISVTRNNGEGQTVTVRGLTGNYNVTTFNGRKLASDNVGRDFNYDVIASELVGGIQVHKTQQAHLPEGGIGAVINIDTRKPLDLGKAVSVSLEADYNERSESTNPKASLIISDTFKDETFGALVSLVHTEATSRFDAYRAAPWHDFTYDDMGFAHDGSMGGEIFRAPMFPKITMNQDERKRTGGTLALQWRPTNELDVNFDALYTKYNIESTGKVLSLALPTSWGPFGEYTDYSVGADGFLDSVSWNTATLELLEANNPRESSTYQLGINVNYVMDEFEFNIDLSHSRAENQNDGDTNFVVVRAGVDSASINWDNGQVIPDISLSETLDENSDYGAHYSRIDGDNVIDENTRFVFDGIYEPDGGIITKVLFGAGYNRQEKDKVYYAPANGSIFALDYMAEVNGQGAETVEIGGNTMWALPSNVIIPGNFSNFGGGANVPSSWASIDVDALYAFYDQLDPDAYLQLVPERVEHGGNTYNIEEEILHAYGELIIEDNLFGRPYLLDFGVRYLKTDITSSGYSQNPANLVFGANGQPANDDWKNTELVHFDGSYDKLLPSMNFKISLTDEVVFRIAASQAMSRPALTQLSPNTSINPVIDLEDNSGKSKRSMWENDPGLAPYTADQFDTSLEWYYSDEGHLAFATFFKELNSFVKTEQRDEVIAGQEFTVYRPYNDEDKSALIRGYELAWYQTFDEFLPESLAGFGINTNYSYNNSVSGEFDENGNEKPFYGLSKHQYNISLFYENHGVVANLYYNYRSEYLAYDAWHWTYDIWGWTDEERATATSWEDLGISLSYEVTDNLKLTADASNLLDPDYIEYLGDNKENILYSASFGRRYSLGIRYQF